MRDDDLHTSACKHCDAPLPQGHDECMACLRIQLLGLAHQLPGASRNRVPLFRVILPLLLGFVIAGAGALQEKPHWGAFALGALVIVSTLISSYLREAAQRFDRRERAAERIRIAASEQVEVF